MENQLIVTLKVDELKGIINESVSNAISKIPHQPKEDDSLLRRKDVAKLFSVSLVTISAWMKSGKLPYHRINSRIFFKRKEVMEAMQSTQKYKRLHK
ncbi:MAG: helix-turn-helix domain-containing protein [Bacteroidetes bacterium]|nr:helix-turn-helix domain-containing protein [Bacteroidota bacterium]